MRDAAEFVTVRDAVAPHTCRGKPLMFREGEEDDYVWNLCTRGHAVQMVWAGRGQHPDYSMQGVRGASHSGDINLAQLTHSLLAEERQTGKRKETKRMGKRQNKKVIPLNG